MMLWNTGLAQGNTETNELGYTSGLMRMFLFSECKTLSSPLRTVPVYFGKGSKEKWLESVILMKMCEVSAERK